MTVNEFFRVWGLFDLQEILYTYYINDIKCTYFDLMTKYISKTIEKIKLDIDTIPYDQFNVVLEPIDDCISKHEQMILDTCKHIVPKGTIHIKLNIKIYTED